MYKISSGEFWDGTNFEPYAGGERFRGTSGYFTSRTSIDISLKIEFFFFNIGYFEKELKSVKIGLRAHY